MRIIVLFITLTSFMVTRQGVIELKTSQFDRHIKGKNHTLIHFYSNECGFCKLLNPVLKKVDSSLQRWHNISELIADVDAEIADDIAKQHGITGFPKLKYFINGQSEEYTGDRSHQDLFMFATRKQGIFYTELKTMEDFNDFLSLNEKVAILYDKSGSKPDLVILEKLAAVFKTVIFARVFDKDLLQQLNITKLTFKVHDNLDDLVHEFTQPFTYQLAFDFITKHQHPKVLAFTDKAVERIFHQGNTGIFLLMDKSDASKQAEKVFREAGRKFNDKIIFSISKKEEDLFLFNKLADYLGPKEGQLPSIFISQSIGHNKYLFSDEITVDNIGKFIDDYENRRLELYHKSEDLPLKNDGLIKILVGKNFDQLVYDSEDHFVVLVYDTECDHSQRFTPIFRQVAIKKKDQYGGIQFGMIEGKKNEIPKLQVPGYPQVMLYKKGDKRTPIKFLSEKSEESLVRFLEYHLNPQEEDL